VGSFHWAGSQCSCGAWVTPAIRVHKSSVDIADGSAVVPITISALIRGQQQHSPSPGAVTPNSAGLAAQLPIITTPEGAGIDADDVNEN
jgi:hypothetical protein